MQDNSMEKERKSRVENPWEKEYPYECFKYEVNRKEKIATVTINDPSGADALPFWKCYVGVRLIDEWERDDDVKVVIIKGGGKNFCTGHTLDDYLAHTGARTQSSEAPGGRRIQPTNRPRLLANRDAFIFQTRLLCSLKPTIAQVHGMCVAYGLHIMEPCDMAIASDDAHFGEIGQQAGVSGILGTPHWNTMNIGRKLFRESAMCGRTFSAKEAAQMGMINRVVPREKLEEEVWKEAKRIAIVPIDGLVTGKYGEMIRLYENGAVVPGFDTFPAHTIKHEPDEFHFFRIIREKGAKEAIRQRKELYAPIGGFGAAAEVDRW